jgi:hypothetical protein
MAQPENITGKVTTTVEKRQIMPAVTVKIPMPQGAAVPAQTAPTQTPQTSSPAQTQPSNNG